MQIFCEQYHKYVLKMDNITASKIFLVFTNDFIFQYAWIWMSNTEQ